MYKIMQKYNRKFLAIVMAFLMIAFIIPQFSKQPTPSTIPAGTFGGETITVEDVHVSHAYWDMIRGKELPGIMIQEFDRQSGQSVDVPLVEALFTPATTSAEQQTMLGQVVSQIDNHPVMFVLLQREAMRNGVTISERDLEGVLGEIRVKLPDRTVLYDNVRNTETGDRVRAAVRQFLLMNASFLNAMSVIKVSQPLLQNRVSRELQEIKLNFVEYDDKNYLDKVAPPTPDQIKEQFDKYADVLPSQADLKTNPFAFGYKYPDRVKIQDIGISQAEVKKAIRAAGPPQLSSENRKALEGGEVTTDYLWEVAARMYFNHHGSEFATTQPATTRSSDSFSLAATSKPGTQPTTKPFAEVRDQIIEDLIRPEAEKLQTQIEARLTSQMREDWNAYHSAVSKATTAPSSSAGVPFDSADYFSKLAEQVQKQFKVVPTVQTFADKFRDSKELADLPGIGKANAEFGQQFLPFNIYATSLVAKFGKNPLSEVLPQIQVFEPSRPLSDFADDTTWIFRVIDADPSHKPADSREVLQKVEEDIRQESAYNLARADAEKLVDAAKKTSFRAAAIAATKSPTVTPYIRFDGPLPSEVPVSTTSRDTFVQQAFEMLSDAAQNKPTVTLIGLPRDSKVLVSQLADVRRIPLFAGQSLEPMLARQIKGELGQNMYQQWYRYDSVVDRLHFVDANKKKDEG